MSTPTFAAKWYKETVKIPTKGKGLYPFTHHVQRLIQDWGVDQGMCYVYMPHTSASLVISESYDPTAKVDLEEFMERLVPEDQHWFKHTLEGPDDSPSHMRSMLTETSLSIPIDGGSLSIGTWQGLYLFEHRSRSHFRKVLIRCLSIE
ncbi:MAG: YjbQ family protein [Chloroflexota bacterium]|nr:MAG: YjbQ family protein [Chloroflexota bacterium]